MSKSEIAKIRGQIELEAKASRFGLEGYAIISRRDFIKHKYEQASCYVERSEKHVKEDGALVMHDKELTKYLL